MKNIILYLLLSIPCNTYAQEVLTLENGDSPGVGSLGELDWLVGYWTGTGLGGDCEELWMPALDNSMVGLFRYSRSGTVNFSEHMAIEATGESLMVKVKHFHRDLSPWEEKDKWVEFQLIKIEGQTAWFNGVTYHRQGDELLIKLLLQSGADSMEETFHLVKSAL